MCFGGGSKAPTPTPPPPPAPVPTESQAGVLPNTKSQLDRLRFGLASTIKTGPRGLTGSGPNLTSAVSAGKNSLGA